MSQKQVILEMLEAAGPNGVHSFRFYEMRMPRGAAAICELRKEGYPIDSRPERHRGGSEGVRYFLACDRLLGAGVTAPRWSSGAGQYDPFGEWS